MRKEPKETVNVDGSITPIKTKKPFYKTKWFIALAILFLLSAFANAVSGDDEKSDPVPVVAEQEMSEEIEQLTKAKQEAESKLNAVQAELNTTKKELEKTKAEFAEYKEIMSPYEALSEADAEAKLAEAERIKAEADALKAEKAAADKAAREAAAAEKAAKEAEAKAAREAEERLGYETGITYDQLARTPKEYVGKKFKFTGTVVQLMEGTTFNQLRFAVNDDYDQIIYLEYDPKLLSERVLEDDTITIYATGFDTITYQSTIGGSITVPAALVDKLEIHK